MNGEVKVLFFGGDSYAGDAFNDAFDGFGTYIDRDGKRYRGLWRKNKF